MEFRLPPEAGAAGHSLIALDTTGSTNADAMARLRAGHTGPVWVVSGHQTAGRGRRGSAWQTPPGNLAASLGLVLDAEPAALATLGFVAGLALIRALDQCCPDLGSGSGQGGEEVASPFTLKWPNDVLAHGDKLAGILLETEALPQGRAVVIGIGVNVLHAPEGLPYTATSLSRLGRHLSAAELFLALSVEWDRAYRVWDEGRGFAPIREAWLARAAGLGRPVSVRAGRQGSTGTFETIDPHGQLVLRRADGALQKINAGDVHFGEAATVRPEVAA